MSAQEGSSRCIDSPTQRDTVQRRPIPYVPLTPWSQPRMSRSSSSRDLLGPSQQHSSSSSSSSQQMQTTAPRRPTPHGPPSELAREGSSPISSTHDSPHDTPRQQTPSSRQSRIDAPRFRYPRYPSINAAMLDQNRNARNLDRDRNRSRSPASSTIDSPRRPYRHRSPRSQTAIQETIQEQGSFTLAAENRSVGGERQPVRPVGNVDVVDLTKDNHDPASEGSVDSQGSGYNVAAPVPIQTRQIEVIDLTSDGDGDEHEHEHHDYNDDDKHRYTARPEQADDDNKTCGACYEDLWPETNGAVTMCPRCPHGHCNDCWTKIVAIARAAFDRNPSNDIIRVLCPYCLYLVEEVLP